MSQYAIPLSATPSFAAEDYVLTGANRDAHAQLTAWPDWPAHALWLCGPAGSGKSHLASVWAAQAQARRLEPAELAQSGVWLQDDKASAFLLDALPDTPDDAQEEGLFHLLNHVRAERRWLLIVQETPPARSGLRLPDLRSRVNALPVVALPPPDDDLLRAVWFKHFADRQVQVSSEVIDFLLARHERSFAAIRRSAAALDEAALAQGRAITIPFVKSVLPPGQ